MHPEDFPLRANLHKKIADFGDSKSKFLNR